LSWLAGFNLKRPVPAIKPIFRVLGRSLESGRQSKGWDFLIAPTRQLPAGPRRSPKQDCPKDCLVGIHVCPYTERNFDGSDLSLDRN